MNDQKSNEVSVVTNSNRRITAINGIEYPWVKGMKGVSITTINGKVFIDGFELNKNGEWKRTLRALWHLIF
ncbi:Uncharacterised protein [[Clostridium] sordellii]|uniref:hypothetical protein n=1 Tax=Paraclostridium sordellii TaxID=1505 RepID=UPI0005EA2EF8|nr:hypothetical protein [Paeniclostridium sordellii]CEQ01669.1 Uncharacterised protein [[Clostridium] sordellii] [Paeniclostridium sordellii]